MPVFKDISGHRFGRLIAKNLSNRDKNGIAIWSCQCDCGNLINVRLVALTQKSTQSCGCLNTQKRIVRFQNNQLARTHGLSKHYLYNTWSTMKQRCYNSKTAKYPSYGGRGIKVCDRWLNSFESFLEDMGDRPDKFTLNRKDNDGDYSPENCEWCSFSEQNVNRRKYKRSLFNEL